MRIRYRQVLGVLGYVMAFLENTMLNSKKNP